MPKFPESKLAHKWLDGLRGIEIGGSAHNHFNIAGCINVDYTDEMTAHKQAEVRFCGEFLPVDVIAEAWRLPFQDGDFDYVINSHVIEHCPDTISTILEWHRVVKDGGLIFFNVPNRDDGPEDKQHPYTDLHHHLADWKSKATIETHPCVSGQGPRGHYHHYRLETFLELLDMCFGDSLPVLERLEKDDKVGNGFMIVCRVVKDQKITKFYRDIDALPNLDERLG
jgi:SAM-dependent methyltransferase